ncbi:MAG: hypothetical protein ACT4QA_23970 [Panacagrimonas sp.]
MSIDIPEFQALDPSGLRLIDLPALRPGDAEWLALRGVDATRLAQRYLFEQRHIQMRLHTAQGRPDIARQLVESASIAERLATLDFQDGILRRGYFAHPNPVGGDVVVSVHSVAAGNSLYYRFGGPHPFVLVAGRYTRGYACLALWLLRERAVIALSPGFTPDRVLPLLKDFQVVIEHAGDRYRAYVENPVSSGVAILLNTPPFPHHLWNELPGVQRLFESGLLKNARRIYACDEPLGPIEELYPELKGRVQCCRRSEAMREVLQQHLVLVRPGSLLIPGTVIQRVMRVAESRASPAARDLVRRLSRRGKPVLGITLRLNNRRWVSQRNGIVSLIKALHRRELPFEVILFGFSLVHGHVPDPRLDVMLAEERALCRYIERRCPEVPITSLVGESIFDCTVLARYLDFYVANHGTIQHKIGWFSDCPGIVHANRLTIERSVSFFATMVANLEGIPPSYIPLESVRDVGPDPPVPATQGRPNLQDYDFDWRELLAPAIRALRTRRPSLGAAADRS